MEYVLESMVQIGVADEMQFGTDEGTKIVVGSVPALSRNFMKDFRELLSGISLWGFVKGRVSKGEI
jgi:hypothetical protein